jgi:hypothetical protein
MHKHNKDDFFDEYFLICSKVFLSPFHNMSRAGNFLGERKCQNNKKELSKMERDMFERIPDEVLEFILAKLSPYDDLTSASEVSQRFQRCARNVALKKNRDFIKAVHDMSLQWRKQVNRPFMLSNFHQF